MIAVAGITFFVVVMIGLHLLDTALDPLRQATSEYAVGPYKTLMTSAFLSMTVCCPVLALGLNLGLPESGRSRIGLVLLGLFGVCTLIAALFPIEPQGWARTTTGTIHRINGAVAFLSLTIGVVLVSRRFKDDERWSSLHESARILSMILVAAWVATFGSIIAGLPFVGLFQRIFLATFVIWFLLTAAHLRVVATDATPRDR